MLVDGCSLTTCLQRSRDHRKRGGFLGNGVTTSLSIRAPDDKVMCDVTRLSRVFSGVSDDSNDQSHRDWQNLRPITRFSEYDHLKWRSRDLINTFWGHKTMWLECYSLTHITGGVWPYSLTRDAALEIRRLSVDVWCLITLSEYGILSITFNETDVNHERDETRMPWQRAVPVTLG